MIRLANLILRLTVPASRHRACILGDLAQLYETQRARHGPLRAALWYWAETLSAAARYTIDRLRRLHHPKRGSNSTGRSGPMEPLTQDLAYALRALKRTPGFTLATVLTIALGIGATTTIFSVANAVLFQPPPGVRDTDRLITAHRVAQDGSGFHAFGYPAYEDYRTEDNGLSGLAAFSMTPLSLSQTGEPEMTMGLMVSENYLDVVGTRPALGRFFLPDEGGIDVPQMVAVLSHRTWQRRFAGDSSVVGQTITVNRQPFTVVGVAEEKFAGHATLVDVGVFIPLSATTAIGGSDLSARDRVSLELVGRLADGVPITQAQQAMDLIAQRMAEAFPEVHRFDGIEVLPYTAMLAPAAGPATTFMGLLFAVSAIILVIACVNVGGMLLARASTRGKEMALRLAIGAPRRRLIRQLLTESTALFLIGGGVGTALTVYATRLLNALQLPIDLPIIFDFSPDLRALAFSLSLGLVTGIVFGLAPAFHTTKHDLNTTLKEDSNAIVRTRLRSGFVVAQVAGSALLLVGAGLFVRALGRADAIELGMDPNNVHIAQIDLEVHNYTVEESRVFYDDLLQRIQQMPGVESAGFIDLPPLSLGNQTTAFFIEGREPIRGVGRHGTDFAVASPTYFETMRIPINQGRRFTDADAAGAPGVAIINETIARNVWPGENPVGKRMKFGSFTDSLARDIEVVGVVPTGKYRTIGEEDRNMVLLPHAQMPQREAGLMIRVTDDSQAWSQRVREAIDALDPALPLQFNGAYRDLMGLALLPNQAAAALASLFGGLGLLLASVGLYGVLAFFVTQRSREIGIRMALGARPSQVRSMVLGQGARLAGIGLLVGMGVAALVTRLLRGLLFGVSPVDPVTFGSIAAILMAVAATAALLPALRATRTNPVTALRQE